MASLINIMAGKFPGFTLPEGAWLPPELIYLMPHLTPGQLKCAIAAIYHYLQVGGAEPLSLTDFERITGMGRAAVVRSLKSLYKPTSRFQILEREKVGQSFLYFPKIKFSSSTGQSLSSEISGDAASINLIPASIKLIPVGGSASIKKSQLEESESKLININSLSDSLNLTDSTETDLETKIDLIKELRSAGVYLHTAQKIVSENTEETIRLHLEHYAYALKSGFAGGPGWLVTSIKESWPAPLGFEKNHGQHKSCPECGGPWVDGEFSHNRGCPDE